MDGYNYRNESKEQVITEIEIHSPMHPHKMSDPKRAQSRKLEIMKGAENYLKFKDVIVGQENERFGFVHKKDINKATVYGYSGFKGTIYYENDYEIVIKDNYRSIIKERGVMFSAAVRFKGDKDDVTWEQLEARRLYFKRLVDQTIASVKISDIKL